MGHLTSFHHVRWSPDAQLMWAALLLTIWITVTPIALLHTELWGNASLWSSLQF